MPDCTLCAHPIGELLHFSEEVRNIEHLEIALFRDVFKTQPFSHAQPTVRGSASSNVISRSGLGFALSSELPLEKWPRICQESDSWTASRFGLSWLRSPIAKSETIELAEPFNRLYVQVVGLRPFDRQPWDCRMRNHSRHQR